MVLCKPITVHQSQTRTFTASDGCGNSATAARTVTWTADITPPSITCPANVTLGCNAAIPAFDITSVTASDGCGTPTVSFVSDVAVLTGCTEVTTRTYRAVDACGNSATCAQLITRTVDVTPPSITATGTTLTLGCNPVASDINAALGTATATDACGVPTVTSSDGAVSTTSCSSSQTRTFTAVDACGNSATVSRTVTWLSAPSPPTITVTGTTTTLGCNPTASDINAALGTATASAACGTPIVTFTDGAVQTNSCSQSQTRTFTASDGCGNSATAARTVTWTADITPPSITCPANVTLGCNAAIPAFDITSVTASDGCGTPTVSFVSDVAVLTGCTEVTTRTYRAVDACGNSATCAQLITRTVDVTPPSITATGTTLTLGCNPAS